MRRPKASLKKYFYFTLICALLLIFGFNIKESEVWKTTKVPSLTLFTLPGLLDNNSNNNNKKGQSVEQKIRHKSLEKAHRERDGNNADREQQQQFIFGNLHSNYEYNDDYDNGGGNSDSYTESDHQRSMKYSNTGTDKIMISKFPSTVFESTENIESQSYGHLQQQQQLSSNPIATNVIETSSNRYWFFKNGKVYPKPLSYARKGNRRMKKASVQGAKLFPYQDPHNDRIVNQLMYVPHNYEDIKASGKLKTILVYNGLGPWNVKQGREVFLRSKCPVDTCEITAVRDRSNTADMILYKDYYLPPGSRYTINLKQVTMLYYLECPYHTQNVKVPNAINWTATYRRDSDIVAPYEKWVYYDNRIHQMEQDHNYAENKTKKVAWFVSNCGARNGRLQYAHELSKYIDVDIYGACGNFKCSRTTADKCFELLDRDYKFYLAFENSNCRDYVTEKFFVNALNRNILPIVMGARPEDYEVSAPYRSYIHVDEFTSAKELADYLHILDKDDKLYNSYFNWKGTGEFINTYYWCRVCAALHDEESLRKPRWYIDVNEWWRGRGVCTISSWRNYKARKDIITDD